MLKVVVDRQKWYRGHGSRKSRLLVTEETYLVGFKGSVTAEEEKEIGRMCCLGFACLAGGVKKEKIENRCYPSNVIGLPETLSKLVHTTAKGTTIVNSPICDLIARANDACSLSETKREAELIDLGGLVGVEFEFIN